MSTVSWAVGASVAAGLILSPAVSPALAATGSGGPPGLIVVVQAVPKQSLDVAIDGKTVHRAADVGSILGPFSVDPGRHRVRFTEAGKQLVAMVDVASGSSHDVVVHLPAQVDGAPVVNTYRTPRAPIGPGKARVLIAHTATVAPADVRVDGKVVFHDIANGEYATADLPAGAHTVALLPAGLSKPPILGPLHVDLTAGTATMVYAVGNPRDHSMNVILHSAVVTSNGAVAPASIDTGQAGLAAHVRVVPFARPAAPRVEPSRGTGPATVLAVGALLGAAALLGVASLAPGLRRRGRAPTPRGPH
jgi:hypothetical protein